MLSSFIFGAPPQSVREYIPPPSAPYVSYNTEVTISFKVWSKKTQEDVSVAYICCFRALKAGPHFRLGSSFTRHP